MCMHCVRTRVSVCARTRQRKPWQSINILLMVLFCFSHSTIWSGHLKLFDALYTYRCTIYTLCMRVSCAHTINMYLTVYIIKCASVPMLIQHECVVWLASSVFCADRDRARARERSEPILYEHIRSGSGEAGERASEREWEGERHDDECTITMHWLYYAHMNVIRNSTHYTLCPGNLFYLHFVMLYRSPQIHNFSCKRWSR